MSRNRKISLSSNAASFDAKLNEAPVVETPATETIETVTEITENGPVIETVEVPVDENVSRETPSDEGSEQPTSEGESEAPVVRRHMTMGVVKGARMNGIGAPAPNGKCHMTWRLFDSLTAYEGETLALPALGDALIAAQAEGYNPGNVRIEYPRWRKWNGFAAVARRAKVAAPVEAPAIAAPEAPVVEAPVAETADA